MLFFWSGLLVPICSLNFSVWGLGEIVDAPRPPPRPGRSREQVLALGGGDTAPQEEGSLCMLCLAEGELQ